MPYVDTLLLLLIALWLFIGGGLAGYLIFQTHQCVNTNFQKQAIQLEEVHHLNKLLVEQIAHMRGVKATEDLCEASEVQNVNVTNMPEIPPPKKPR